MADLFLIRKGGYYYRPNAQGYTASVHEAGRYPEAEAVAHMMASDPGEITIFPAPVVAASKDVASDIRAMSEQIVIEHVGSGALDMDGLATAIATALETATLRERLRAATVARSAARNALFAGARNLIPDKVFDAVHEASGDPAPQLNVEGPANQIIGQIEELFPNWRSYRDLLDCIECTLHDLRKGGR